MSPERWRKIDSLFHAALEKAPAQRSAFIGEAVAGDEGLRRQVESLLQIEGDGILDAPLWQTAEAEVLKAGARLGPYQIVGSLGEGGMGVVYRALDTRLGRQIAIKTSKAQFSGRFQREARAVASLSHPNICALHDVGPNYLVMELIEGPTLAERMAEGPIPVGETLQIARQIADALEAAHEGGIVHRDLKPSNIKLMSEGKVKLLDFGLAKAPAPTSGNPDDSPTFTASKTGAGIILGTAAYMSPEQAAGKSVDKRADIWSFGVVLWEMLTRHRLFAGDTLQQTLADVLSAPIDFDQVPRDSPPAIRALLRRCLDRDIKTRLRDIGEARIAIEGLRKGETLPEAAPEPAQIRSRWLAWSVATMAFVCLATLAFLHFREKPPTLLEPVRFQIPVGGVLSPDGRKLAYTAGGRLRVYFMESQESRDLAPAVGVPFWSPDSHFIGYFDLLKLKKIGLTGGPSQTVASLSGVVTVGTWSHDDVIVFANQFTGLFRVSASGGIPLQITALDPSRQEDRHTYPSFLPDGRHFLYLRLSADKRNSGIYLGSLDARPEQQSSVRLLASRQQALYTPSADPDIGYLLFVRDGTLMAEAFDNRRMALTGRAMAVAERIGLGGGSGGGFADYSASTNAGSDVLAFGRNAELQLTWYDRVGGVLGTIGEPAVYFGPPVLSPDGTRVVVSKRAGEDASLWLLNLSSDGGATRFTFGSVFDAAPSWSRDGGRVIYVSDRDGPEYFYEKPVDGKNDGVIRFPFAGSKINTVCSRDGRYLMYVGVNPKTQHDIMVLPLQGDPKPVPFVNTEFEERDPHFSPDGRWVAYISNESGAYEVYVRSFSMNSKGTAVAPGGRWQVSNGGGSAPRWRGDGRELYYRSQDGRAMAVNIATDPAFRAGKPQPLGFVFNGLWDCASDGERFLVMAPKSTASEPYTVVLNWQAGLKKP
jgi:serine/threonine protein kinase/Tol biopolymer transport system component